MSEPKKQYARIGQYKLAKDGKTKYIEINCAPNAPEETQLLVQRIIDALGSDRMYVNLFDADFKSQHNIPDFVKGSISVVLGAEKSSKPAGNKRSSKDEVNF